MRSRQKVEIVCLLRKRRVGRSFPTSIGSALHVCQTMDSKQAPVSTKRTQKTEHGLGELRHTGIAGTGYFRTTAIMICTVIAIFYWS
jgi:hypothetical protein